jgi:hypothetical protein
MTLADVFEILRVDRMKVNSPLSIPVVALVCLVFFAFIHRLPKTLRLPPGPSGYPLIGNLIEIAKADRPHLLFPQWSREYGTWQQRYASTASLTDADFLGNMVHFSVFGFQSILVNKLSIANDLLEKRGALYSDRPNMILENEL